MKRFVPVIAISLAVIASAVAAIIITLNRSETARQIAEAAASAEARADQERKTAALEAQAETEKRRTEEARAKAEETQLAASRVELEKASVEQATEIERRAANEAAAEKAKAEAEAAEAQRSAAELTAAQARDERAKAEAEAAAAKAQATAEAARLETEKLKSEKIIAEAKLLELRKIDFETAQQALIEWRADLEEREAALKPEKTIADLAWAGGTDDLVVDESGKLKKKEKQVYDPEKDPNLSRASRELAKAERLAREGATIEAKRVREAAIAPLEKLYVEALKEGRTLDAEYCRKCLKALYPDWELKKVDE